MVSAHTECQVWLKRPHVELLLIHGRSGISINISDILLYSPSLYSRGCSILLRRYIYLYFQPHCTACRLLVPWPRIKPILPALEAQCLKHWTSRKVPVLHPSQQGSWGWHILLLVRLSSSAWLDHGVSSGPQGITEAWATLAQFMISSFQLAAPGALAHAVFPLQIHICRESVHPSPGTCFTPGPHHWWARFSI